VPIAAPCENFRPLPLSYEASSPTIVLQLLRDMKQRRFSMANHTFS